VEPFVSFKGYLRCVGFDRFGVIFGSFECLNGFVARLGGFAMGLLNSFIFVNLFFDSFISSSFLTC
jgi:hypothetical protein